MEGVSLDELGIVTLSTGLYGGDCVAGVQYIFAVRVEQGKGRVKDGGLLGRSRFRLGKSGAYPKCEGEDEKSSDE